MFHFDYKKHSLIIHVFMYPIDIVFGTFSSCGACDLDLLMGHLKGWALTPAIYRT